MATMKCSKCKKQITAHPCVFCSGKSAQSSPDAVIAIGLVTFMILGLVWMVSGGSGNGGGSGGAGGFRGTGGFGGSGRSEVVRPPVNEEIDLGARVQRSDLQLRITNLDSFVWTDCEIILNAGILRSGFSQQVGPIKAGGAVKWLLMDFTRPSGERFDPLAVVVTDVILTCDTARGPGVHYAAF